MKQPPSLVDERVTRTGTPSIPSQAHLSRGGVLTVFEKNKARRDAVTPQQKRSPTKTKQKRAFVLVKTGGTGEQLQVA